MTSITDDKDASPATQFISPGAGAVASDMELHERILVRWHGRKRTTAPDSPALGPPTRQFNESGQISAEIAVGHVLTPPRSQFNEPSRRRDAQALIFRKLPANEPHPQVGGEKPETSPPRPVMPERPEDESPLVSPEKLPPPPPRPQFNTASELPVDPPFAAPAPQALIGRTVLDKLALGDAEHGLIRYSGKARGMTDAERERDREINQTAFENDSPWGGRPTRANVGFAGFKAKLGR